MEPKKYRAYLITGNASKQRTLRTAIAHWIVNKNVGYESGEPTEDPNNRQGNQVSIKNHHPASPNAVYYSVAGQNCVWWATSMLLQNGITLPKNTSNAILKFNHGIGFADDVISGKRSASKASIMSDIPRIKGLGGYDLDFSLLL